MSMEYEMIVDELKRISENPYLETDHEKNHQTFARALLWIMRNLKP